MAMPNGSATTVETTATRNDSATAVHSWGESSSTRWLLRHRFDQETKAVFLEYYLVRRAAQESEIARSGGAFARGRLRCRIGNRRIGTVREYADDSHLRFDLGVGLVDDTDWCLAARHESERCAHVLGWSELGLGRRPGAEIFQRRLGIKPGRHGLDVGHGNTSVAGELGDVEALFDLDVAELGIGRCDQHQLVAEQIDA